MAQNPPRPAAARPGAQASPASGPSVSGTRTKGDGADKPAPGTFFLGRYRVVDEIGVGGMASVHLGRMDGPGGFQKWVAIKRIHPHLVEDDQFVDMFLDEARIAAGINHANVAQVFDLGKDDNTYWIAMEYLHGEPLREIMRRSEERHMRVTPELAARICSDAAEGLHAAHELRGKKGELLGLVHRDVTPHNLFLTYDGYTKVVDFGIAKVADRLSSTRAGTLKGKLAYMSPEQVRGADIDRTTDIFALGVVLWELVTNQRLFRMDTDLDTLEKVQACVVPPPTSIVPDFPPELESVILRALAKRKQDRFQTGREFSRALQNFLMRRGAFVGPEEVSTFVRNVFADRIQKREAHLAWAAEVTSTINVDQLREQGGLGSGEELSFTEDKDQPGAQKGGPAPAQQGAAAARPAPAPLPPAPSQSGLASSSLIDDDEDIATTVATREQIESAAPRGQPGVPDRGPRPAAGMGPLPGAMPPPRGPGYPNNGPAPFASGGFGGQPGQGMGGPMQPMGQMGGPQQGFGFGNAQPMREDRTAAFPNHGGGGDLGSTMALPNAPSDYNRQQQQQMGGMQQPQPFGFGPPPQQPYGAPNQQMGYGGPMYPGQQMQGYGMAPQSQIETAMSLPRPDPAAIWLAQQQQEKERGERRNTGVLIAVVALTALCVIGIGALIFLKLHSSPAATPTADGTAAASADAQPAPAGTGAEAAPAPDPSTPANAAPTARTASAPQPQAAGPSPRNSPQSAPATPKPAEKEEPGFLTIVCNPFCDEVIDQGRSLGPSPVVHLAVPPGQHRITLKKDGATKVISVIVVSGQVTAQRVPMK